MYSFMKRFLPVVLGATSVLSLTINAPSSPQSGSTTTITWTSTSTDPTFSIELTHPSFNQAIAIANNVDPLNNQVTVTLPIVPAGDQYTLEAVNITNINQVFSTSADFSIAAAPSPSPSASTASPTSSPAVSGVSGASVPPPGTANTGSATVPSATAPAGSSVGSIVGSSSAASGSQSASVSGASPPASTTPSAASSLAPLGGSLPGLFIAVGTALFAGAWIL